MSSHNDTSGMGSPLIWAMSWLIGFGILTLGLFTFSIPFLLLTLVFAAPLLLPLIPLAIAAGAWLTVRGVVRRIRGRRRTAARGGASPTARPAPAGRHLAAPLPRRG